MNKKIFTLLVGACMLISSSFTVNAQRISPYSPKQPTDVDQTKFNDLLTADTVKQLTKDPGNYFYLLGITGLANPAGTAGTAFDDTLSMGYSSTEQSYVLYVDKTNLLEEYLRIDKLSKLDSLYGFVYEGSYKFGAIRRASWCLTYHQSGSVGGSNVTFDFTQMETGRPLEAPAIYDNPSLWANDGYGNQVSIHWMRT